MRTMVMKPMDSKHADEPQHWTVVDWANYQGQTGQIAWITT